MSVRGEGELRVPPPGPRAAAAALTVLALILAGCGGAGHAGAGTGATPGTSHGSAAGTRATVVLHGGASATITACGAAHHYRTYPARANVAVTGQVTPVPAGHWKVKLQLKVCRGAAFAEFAKLKATRDRHTGAFSAHFSAPARGDYSVRAVVYLADGGRVKGAKRHLATH